jgi:hypothetical protein
MDMGHDGFLAIVVATIVSYKDFNYILLMMMILPQISLCLETSGHPIPQCNA